MADYVFLLIIFTMAVALAALAVLTWTTTREFARALDMLDRLYNDLIERGPPRGGSNVTPLRRNGP